MGILCDPVMLLKKEGVELPVALIENKLVFAGDRVWHKSGREYLVQGVEKLRGGLAFCGSNTDGDYVKNYTWDAYAVYRKALAEGKRLQLQNYSGGWVLVNNPKFIYPPERYRVVEEDQHFTEARTILGEEIETTYTKSGATGEITAQCKKHPPRRDI